MRPALGLLALLLVMPVVLSAGLAEAGTRAQAEQTPVREPIVISGDAHLSNLAKRERWAGTGTAADPYRLPAYNVSLPGIHAGQVGIHVRDTQKHLVVADSTVWAIGTKGTGILLENVRNATLERVVVERLDRGIVLHRSSDVLVRDSTVRYASEAGIRLQGSTGIRLVDNEVHIAQRAYDLIQSDRNVFRDNVAATSSGQFGFHFDTQASYDNDIDTSNLVNDVPMRWYVGLKGTGYAPIRMPPISLHTESITNVAQVLFYRCWWLEVRDLYVSHGVTGVLVLDSERVTLLDPVSEKNRDHGIELREGFENKVLRAQTHLNGRDGLRLVDEDVDRVEELRSVDNGRAGLRVDRGGGHLVVGAQLLRNGGEGFAASSSVKNLIVDSEAVGNGGAGFVAGGGVADRFERNVARSNGGAGFDVVRPGGATRLLDLRSEENGGDGLRVQRAGDVFVERLVSRGNARAGVTLDGTSSSHLNDSALHSNGFSGVRLMGGGVVNMLQRLDVRDNRGSGILLTGAGLANQVLDVNLTNHTAGVQLVGSPGTYFERVAISARPGQLGYQFDDEASFDVRLPPSNTVNGTSVRWFNGIAGTAGNPLRLENLTVTQPGITNVGQIVLYKASHVVLPGAIAENGVRGILVHGSSNVTVEEAKVSRNGVGLEFSRTLHSRALGVDAGGSDVGVRLSRTSDSVVRDARAQHSAVVVELRDGSRGNIVEQTNATNVTRAGVVDTSLRPGEVRGDNFVADAGLDKRALPFQPVVFDSAVVGVPREHEVGLEHEWDFGDGTTRRTTEAGPPRVEHTYATEGNFTVTYTMRTASGLGFTDTLRILVWERPEAPRDLRVNASDGRALVTWQPPANARWPVVYEVLRGMPGQPALPVAHLENLTSFLDTDVAINDTYVYSVRALRAPLDGPVGERVSATVKAPVPAPTPLELSSRERTALDPGDVTPAQRQGRELSEEDAPWRLILLGALGFTAVVLVFGGQFVQPRP